MSKKVKKRFLSEYYQVTASSSSVVNYPQLLKIIELFFKTWEFSSNNKLCNLQGLVSLDLPPAFGPSPKELFLLKGKIPPEQISADDSDETNQNEDFAIEGISTFDSFEGNYYLFNKFKEKRSANLPDILTLKNITKLAPLEITSFSISLEFFSIKSVLKFLRFAPVSAATLKLSVTPTSLELNYENNLVLNPENSQSEFKDLDQFLVELEKCTA